MGNEPASAEEKLSLETCDADRRADNEDEAQFEERLETLEVDLEYPAYLHDAHNEYPLAPEKKVINPEQMSEYQRWLMADLDLTMPNTEKLVSALEDKEKYVVHYSNLQFYLRQGLRLKKCTE